MSEIPLTVTDLQFYPVKSCHAASVDGGPPSQLDVAETGLAAHDIRDREYVIVEPSAESGEPAHFVTQRGWGRNNRLSHRSDNCLAFVHPIINKQHLTLTVPDRAFGQLVLPASYEESAVKQHTVNIFNKLLLKAYDQGDEAATFFSDLLDRNVRLVRANRTQRRWVSLHSRRYLAANAMAAADGSPILLVNQASLDYSHVETDTEPGRVPIEQYRGNVIINGDSKAPYDEDYWREIRIGSLRAFVVKACQRCPIPNIDQHTAQRGAGGQKVLANRVGYIDDPNDRQVVFGQNLNHIYVPGQTVNVGDVVQVLKCQTERNFTLIQDSSH